MKESINMEVFDLKVLIKTMVLTHECLIITIVNDRFQLPTIPQIASRLKEPGDKVERALNRLEQSGWLVTKGQSGKGKAVQPTMKAWEMYSAFEIIRPEWSLPLNLYAKYGSKIGRIIVDNKMMNEFIRFLAVEHHEEFREILTDN